MDALVTLDVKIDSPADVQVRVAVSVAQALKPAISDQSKTHRILKMLLDKGAMRFVDIQRELWKMSHTRPFTRAERGYWCTNLLGGRYYHQGILGVFARKGLDGIWRPNYNTVPTHPWSMINRLSGIKTKRAI